jgi:hypothetical protein
MARDDINDAERCAVCDSLYDPHNRGPACPYCEIDKLPKTADGVPVVPDMRLWHIQCGQIYSEVVEGLSGHFYHNPVEESRWPDGEFDAHCCYSTREDAEAARGRHRCE